MERLGSVLQLTMSLSSATIGPKLGVFVIGMFIPFVDATVSGSVIDYMKERETFFPNIRVYPKKS